MELKAKICSSLLCLVCAPFAIAHAAAGAPAKPYPDKPIRFIVTVPTGGAADFVARIVGRKLSESLGQNVVIENRPGASGTIATGIAAKATPDGYTLLQSSVTTFAVAPTLYSKLPYDALGDFAHVSLSATLPLIMVVSVAVPAKSVKETIELAKAKPGQLRFGSAGNATLPHLVGEMFRTATGAQIVHVPYKGSAPAVIDLAAGDIHIMFDAPPSLYAQLKAGRLRPLAAVSAKRSALLPELPTTAELGYPGLEGALWYGVSAPAGVPKGVVERLNRELRKLLAFQDVKERFASQGAEPAPVTPQQFVAFIKTEQAKWGALVRSSGAKVD